MVTIHASSVLVYIVAFFVGLVLGGTLTRHRRSTASITHNVGVLSMKLELDSVDAQAELLKVIESLHEIHELSPGLLIATCASCRAEYTRHFGVIKGNRTFCSQRCAEKDEMLPAHGFGGHAVPGCDS